MSVTTVVEWESRVGAREKLGRWKSPVVFFIPKAGERIDFTPGQARELARSLKRWADAVDPPKPRRKTA